MGKNDLAEFLKSWKKNCHSFSRLADKGAKTGWYDRWTRARGSFISQNLVNRFKTQKVTLKKP